MLVIWGNEAVVDPLKMGGTELESLQREKNTNGKGSRAEQNYELKSRGGYIGGGGTWDYRRGNSCNRGFWSE